MNKKIAIIGGGPAGYFSAITSASNSKNTDIYIIEGTSKPLAKVLISGGGRCNVTNHTLDIKELIKNYPRGSKELIAPFSKFSTEDTIKWFESRGVKLKVEPDNRMFPITDSSKTIADCLEKEAKKYNVKILLKEKVSSISSLNDKFKVITNNNEFIFDKVILATGGNKNSYKFAKDLGHNIVSPVPSLFTFQIKDSLISDLSGISFESLNLKLKINKKTFTISGPVLITHWGLSGPAIIKLSAIAARELFEADYKASLFISFAINKTQEDLKSEFNKIKETNPNKTLVTSNFLNLPKRFWQNIINISKINPSKKIIECSKKELNNLFEILTAKEFKVNGKGIFKEEFVTAGGVDLKEVNFKTMESKITPNLYFAGEILNIDGITGGFNFQNAWTTGWIAGNGN